MKTPGERDDRTRWQKISRGLRPSDPFEKHLELFHQTYSRWTEESGPPPAVLPDPEIVARSHVGRWMAEHGFDTYEQLHTFSVKQRDQFLREAINKLGIRFRQRFSSVLDVSRGVQSPEWFRGARMNIVDSVFAAPADSDAIIFCREGSAGFTRLSVRELDELSARIAAGLVDFGLRSGDAVAVDMPMTVECVAIYLGIVRSGMVVVSIADSFAPEEIATRLRIAGAKAIFTQDVQRRGGKTLPLYEKVVLSNAPCAIVAAQGGVLSVSLRPGDLEFEKFLSATAEFTNVDAGPDDAINVLFSSGTTGTPKAIPWVQTTPIRAALDAYVHQDVHAGDVVAWPTSVGWMMGPWLIFAALLNKATIALYDGAPQTHGFCRFVQDAGVTALGVVPSLVRSWRSSNATDGLDWSGIRVFSSTGEASDPEDMLWLMSRAGYKPVIEYCGGTEIGGSYITSTVVQPNSPSCFSAKTIGTDFVILDEGGGPAALNTAGELFLIPPSLGLSTRLLNADHDDIYYSGCPAGSGGDILRRHGDEMMALPGGFYRALGRADDTMNLGGIKVSSVELERVMNQTEGVVETAAVAVSQESGGPSHLVVYAVVDPVRRVDVEKLRKELQLKLHDSLNPLFKIHEVHLVQALPRTASNKVMRRLLRGATTE